MESDVAEFDIRFEGGNFLSKILRVIGVLGIPHPAFTRSAYSSIKLPVCREYSFADRGSICIMGTVLLVVDVLRDFLIEEFFDLDLVE